MNSMNILDRLFGKTGKTDVAEKRSVRPVEPASKFQKPGSTMLRSNEATGVVSSFAPRLDFNVADRIANTYVINQILGAGSFGTAYLAHHENWNFDVVLKVPHDKILADAENRPRIISEADAWTDLGLHAHIVYCFYVHPIEEVPILVIEYLDGGNLREWISAGRCADLRVGLDLAIQLCHGLEHAHAKGLVHRDIKPENILLTRDGTLKITDFGIVLIARGATQSLPVPTREFSPFGQASKLTLGWGIGTPGYMPPEQLVGIQEVTERSDIFALGVCLYEMLCGRLPYSDRSNEDWERWAIESHERPPAPRQLRNDGVLPIRLCELMQRCVHWDRDRRPESAKLIRTELCAIYAETFRKPSVCAELPEVSLEADGWNNRAVSYLELRKAGQALDAFEKAYLADPTHLEANFNHALVQWRRGAIDDTEALQRLGRLKGLSGVDARCLAIALAELHLERFDPESARAELVNYPNVVKQLFANESSRVELFRSIEGRLGEMWKLSPDYRHVISGGRDHTLKTWNLETGSCLFSLKEHTDWVTALALSSDGHRALSGSADRTARLWDLETGRCLKLFEGHWGEVTAVTFLPKQPEVLSAGGAELRVWDSNTGRCVRILKGYSGFSTSGDGRRALFWSEEDDAAELWDLETLSRLRSYLGMSSLLGVVALSYDGQRALSGPAWEPLDEGTNNSLRVWNLNTGKVELSLKGHSDFVGGLALSADARWALSGSEDGTLKLWDLQSARCVKTLPIRADCNFIEFSNNGQWAVSVSGEEGELHVWRLDVSKPRPASFKPCRPRQFGVLRAQQELRNERLRHIEALCGTGSDAGAYEALIALWEQTGFGYDPRIDGIYQKLLEKGKRGRPLSVSMQRVDAHQNACTAIALSAAGDKATSLGDDRILKFWDVKGHACIQTLSCTFNSLGPLALSRDSRSVLAGTADGRLILSNLESGQFVPTIDSHSSPVAAVVFLPDGHRAVSGAENGSMKIWDLQSGDSIATLDTKSGSVCVLAVGQDDHQVISGDDNGTLKEWDLESGCCLRTLNRDLGSVFALTGDGRHAMSATDTLLAADGGLRMFLWDIESGDCLQTTAVHAPISSVAITPDGMRAGTAHRDGTVTFWRMIWTLEFGSQHSTQDHQHRS